jgi:hypothetical protein
MPANRLLSTGRQEAEPCNLAANRVFKFRLLSVEFLESRRQERAASRLQNCLKPVIVRSGRKATIRRKQ